MATPTMVRRGSASDALHVGPSTATMSSLDDLLIAFENSGTLPLNASQIKALVGFRVEVLPKNFCNNAVGDLDLRAVFPRVTTVGDGCFKGAKGLKSVRLPVAVEAIGDDFCLDAGPELETVDLTACASRLKRIGKNFCRGSSVKVISAIPHLVSTLGDGFCASTPRLTELNAASAKLLRIPAFFLMDSAATTIDIPIGVTSVGQRFCRGCANDSVTYVPPDALADIIRATLQLSTVDAEAELSNVIRVTRAETTSVVVARNLLETGALMLFHKMFDLKEYAERLELVGGSTPQLPDPPAESFITLNGYKGDGSLTLAHWAVIHFDDMLKLLPLNSDTVGAQTLRGFSVLHYAVVFGLDGAVIRQLTANMSPSMARQIGQGLDAPVDITPVHLAIAYRDFETVAALLDPQGSFRADPCHQVKAGEYAPFAADNYDLVLMEWGHSLDAGGSHSKAVKDWRGSADVLTWCGVAMLALADALRSYADNEPKPTRLAKFDAAKRCAQCALCCARQEPLPALPNADFGDGNEKIVQARNAVTRMAREVDVRHRVAWSLAAVAASSSAVAKMMNPPANRLGVSMESINKYVTSTLQSARSVSEQDVAAGLRTTSQVQRVEKLYQSVSTSIRFAAFNPGQTAARDLERNANKAAEVLDRIAMEGITRTLSHAATSTSGSKICELAKFAAYVPPQDHELDIGGFLHPAEVETDTDDEKTSNNGDESGGVFVGGSELVSLDAEMASAALAEMAQTIEEAAGLAAASVVRPIASARSRLDGNAARQCSTIVQAMESGPFADKLLAKLSQAVPVQHVLPSFTFTLLLLLLLLSLPLIFQPVWSTAPTDLIEERIGGCLAPYVGNPVPLMRGLIWASQIAQGLPPDTSLGVPIVPFLCNLTVTDAIWMKRTIDGGNKSQTTTFFGSKFPAMAALPLPLSTDFSYPHLIRFTVASSYMGPAKTVSQAWIATEVQLGWGVEPKLSDYNDGMVSRTVLSREIRHRLVPDRFGGATAEAWIALVVIFSILAFFGTAYRIVGLVFMLLPNLTLKAVKHFFFPPGVETNLTRIASFESGKHSAKDERESAAIHMPWVQLVPPTLGDKAGHAALVALEVLTQVHVLNVLAAFGTLYTDFSDGSRIPSWGQTDGYFRARAGVRFAIALAAIPALNFAKHLPVRSHLQIVNSLTGIAVVIFLMVAIQQQPIYRIADIVDTSTAVALLAGSALEPASLLFGFALAQRLGNRVNKDSRQFYYDALLHRRESIIAQNDDDIEAPPIPLPHRWYVQPAIKAFSVLLVCTLYLACVFAIVSPFVLDAPPGGFVKTKPIATLSNFQ